MPSPLLLLGLGNPGREYVHTRHNAGFRVLDAYAALQGVSFEPQKKFQAEIAELKKDTRPLFLAKPQTFMNLSGDAAQTLLSFYKIPPAQMLVIYDDADLPFGEIRLREKGGAGGHHGMESVIERLGTQDIPRLRIGIGHGISESPLADHVLRTWSVEEETVWKELLPSVLTTIDTWITAR